MAKQQYDVVIVGAGLGGLMTGAILAAKERMKVLVLEKAPVIGGRIISFGKHHGSSYSATEVRELLQTCLFSTIVKSEPDFDQIINKGVLKDFILDGGWHGTAGGDRCRMSWVARALGKRLAMSNIVGFCYLKDNQWLNLPEFTKDWPAESVRERARVGYERQLLTPEQASVYDHVDLKSYLESVTDDKLVQDYYLDLARFQMGFVNVGRASAGEWIKANNGAPAGGAHLITGGGFGEVTGGWKTVADLFASIIVENGGEIRTSHKVTELVIKNWKAEGVVVQGEKGNEEIKAQNVVSNVILYHLPGIISDKYLVGDFKERIGKMYPNATLVGTVCLREPLETQNPKANFVVGVNPCAKDMKITGGPPTFGMEQTSVIDPSRAPEGRYIVQICDIVDPEGRLDLPSVKLRADAMIAFLRQQYPRLDDIMEWYYIHLPNIGYSVALAPGLVGDRRFPIKHPVVRNLFFTGDGVEQWDMGTNGAAHAGVLCASAVSGRRDYLNILPPYWR
jgi:hypothetical protein